ncbi:hypothetical protein D3C71_2007760 [compost metagenome]
MKVPRLARPWSARRISKLFEIAMVGSPIMVYWILAMVSEASCQALCTKWVSVDTEKISTPIFWNSA